MSCYVVLPDLADDVGCLQTNPERERLLAQLRAAADPFDAPVAETAAETAARLAERGEPVTVVEGPRDGRTCAILVRALREREVPHDVLRTDLEGQLAALPSVPAVVADDRIAPPAFTAWPATPVARSPLPMGFERDTLLREVGADRPELRTRLLVVLGLHDLGSNPKEDAYAGLSLLEHNRDLLVNIVEPW